MSDTQTLSKNRKISKFKAYTALSLLGMKNRQQTLIVFSPFGIFQFLQEEVAFFLYGFNGSCWTDTTLHIVQVPCKLSINVFL